MSSDVDVQPAPVNKNTIRTRGGVTEHNIPRLLPNVGGDRPKPTREVSALPPKADKRRAVQRVRYVPEADSLRDEEFG
jgi:hypothetical protein